MLALSLFASCALAPASRPPNVIVVLADDLGYGDLSCYGGYKYKTPHLDNMAAEGVRFTSFYSASAGCTPARAALLTGCYPMRVSLPHVLAPTSEAGLNPSEETLADLLGMRGYRTGMVGKWHLGGFPSLSPLAHGFQEFYGIPYSNDMWPPNGAQYSPLFIYDGIEKIEEIRSVADQGLLTRKLTERALTFIRESKSRQFFLYFAHPMPHVPISASPSFLGKSGAGLYGDVVQEIDWSFGRILRELERLKLDKDTIILFTSDNGPWIPYGDHAGSTGGLREGKGTTFEGGMRMPAIWWWRGKFAPLVVNEVATMMDVLPTLARIAGATMPKLPIDGKDIATLLSGQGGDEWKERPFFYYWPDELQAVRVGKWKLHVPHSHRHQEGVPGKFGKPSGEATAEIGLSLFDLEIDPSETTDVSKDNPEVVKKLTAMIEKQRLVLGDKLTDSPGRESRPAAKVLSGS